MSMVISDELEDAVASEIGWLPSGSLLLDGMKFETSCPLNLANDCLYHLPPLTMVRHCAQLLVL